MGVGGGGEQCHSESHSAVHSALGPGERTVGGVEF